MKYEQDYFDWQKNIGAFGGVANLFKFAPFLRREDRVLDFGCGGGYLLHNIQAAEKIGIEISDVARAEAQKHGLTVYKTTDEAPDLFAAAVISNHTLEHVECPVEELRRLLPKMQPGAKAIFVVPHQKPDEAYYENDVSQHLYTWNPLTLGNLFKAAGFVQIRVDVIRHTWPPNYQQVYQRYGQRGFDLICRLRAYRIGNYQIRAIAEKAR